MINIHKEKLISVLQVTGLVPSRPGRKTHTSTIIRWIHRGVRGRRLEAIRLGGCWYTSVEALARFAEPAPASGGEPADAARRSRARRADRELDKLGL